MPDLYYTTNTTNWYITTTISTTVTVNYFNSAFGSSTPIIGNYEHVPQDNVAQKKARKLLKDNLSVQQWKQFLEMDYFEIIAQSGAVYRIRNGRARNVSKIVDGEAVEVLCAHPSIACPNEDTMLAQKFILETDEQEFRKTANIEQLVNKLPKVVFQVAA